MKAGKAKIPTMAMGKKARGKGNRGGVSAPVSYGARRAAIQREPRLLN
ncbi:hypothetical protein BMS3Abin07_02153 [bacterium BMS3Abin07]|nr:hypothetical protein BMS3Abin07_02153 [bacterium BMS3Abin07]GBE32868.1 hypothetical protein BMS3Bbin05_01796 [bacterium BMS3Bbin05]